MTIEERIRQHGRQHRAEIDAAQNGQHAGDFAGEGCSDQPDVDGQSPPDYITAAALVGGNPHLRPPIIEGVLREGETMNVIASSKAGKSWLVGSLGIAVAAGLPWLGRFAVQRGRVLLMDNELHPQTLARRLHTLAGAMGVNLAELDRDFCVRSFRGALKDFVSLASFFDSLTRDAFKVIICDAAYRFWPAGFDENKNADVARVYNIIDSYAATTGAAIVLVHHATKGNQSEKSVIDVGAGAGSQSRAADCHFVLRPHQADDCTLAGAVVRSWKPFTPIGLRWTFPLWEVDDTLDPAQLREGRQKKPAADAPPAWTPLAFADAFTNSEPRSTDQVLTAAGLEGLSNRTAKSLLRTATAEGFIIQHGTGGGRIPLTYTRGKTA